jgi:uncharacterized alkaline shock family protein YloU
MSTDDGKISVAQGVVQKIAGIACREISGVHAMGASTSRAFGAVRERIPGSSGPNVAQGVGVEVGETQAAIDLDIVVDYGVSIADLGRSIQRNVKQAVERMTGLEVVEVNVNVDDLYLPGSDDQDGDGDAPARPRRATCRRLWSTASISTRSPRRPAAARPSMICARVPGAAWCLICRAGRWLGCG